MPRSGWFADTHPRALEVFLRLQREMPAGRKLRAVLDTSAMLMRLAEENVRRLNPGLSDREVFLRAAARRLDRETMIRAYGWDPESEP